MFSTPADIPVLTHVSFYYLKFQIPKIIETSEPISEDPVSVIIKYLYNYQDFKVIVEHLHDRSCINLYAMAYSMQMPKLLKDLEEYILEKIITPHNAQKFYLEGI